MQTNPESAAAEAVAWVVVDPSMTVEYRHSNFIDGAYWTSFVTESSDIAGQRADEYDRVRGKKTAKVVALYPQSALDALRGEVESERKLRMRAEGLSVEWKKRHDYLIDGIAAIQKTRDAAERRVAQLEIVLEQAMEHPDFLPPGLLEAIESALTKESP